MDSLERLSGWLQRLLEVHQEDRGRLESLRAELAEAGRGRRQLEERLAQALRRIHELEAERGELRDRLDALPDPAHVAEARRRLQSLLGDLEI
jgi:chromosome segregation ATPase